MLKDSYNTVQKFGVIIFFLFYVLKVCSKDALNWLNVTMNTFTIFNKNKLYSFESSIHQRILNHGVNKNMKPNYF